MVGPGVVPLGNSINELRLGAGAKGPLKRNKYFSLLPHRSACPLHRRSTSAEVGGADVPNQFATSATDPKRTLRSHLKQPGKAAFDAVVGDAIAELTGVGDTRRRALAQREVEACVD